MWLQKGHVKINQHVRRPEADTRPYCTEPLPKGERQET